VTYIDTLFFLKLYITIKHAVFAHHAKIWALTGKLEDILKSYDSKMLRHMTRVRWISSEEVAERCGLKMIHDKL